MATSFPTSLDTFTTHVANDVITSADINKIQDSLAAVEAKVGVDNSAVKKSLDYHHRLVGGDTFGVARTSRSFAFKGGIFTPAANMNLYGLRWLTVGMTPGNTAGACVITVSAGAVATITTSADTYTSANSSAAYVDFLFSSPVALTGGTAYGLMVGFNSSAGGQSATSDLPTYCMEIAKTQLHWTRPGTWSSSVYHVASLAPAVATSVTTATTDQSAGSASYAVFPIFTWA